MADLIRTVQDLRPGKEYIVKVKAKNRDLNTYSEATDSIRFIVPSDDTIPSDINNLAIYASFQNVMFVFDFVEDFDISHYLYELYSSSDIDELNNPTGTLISSGREAGNVFSIAVENSTDEIAISYWGRVRAVDTSGNLGSWTELIQTDQDTPLIDEEYIVQLTASKITAGTIGAHTINLNGANSIIQSSNFVAGSVGWQIKGDGTAEFDSQYIRGDLNAGSITVGNGDYNYWNKNNNGDFRVGDELKYLFWDSSEETLNIKGTLDAVDGTFSGSLSGVDGTFTGTLSGVDGAFSGTVTVGDATNKITLKSTSSSLTTAIYAGTGSYNNANTGFWLDASGRFSLKDRFVWNGSNLVINGVASGASSNLEIVGAVIRTVDGVDTSSTESGVVLSENDILLYNRSGDEATIKFEGNTSQFGKIQSSISGIEISCLSQTGGAKYVVGSASYQPEYEWYGWNSTFATLSKASASADGIFSLNGYYGGKRYLSNEDGSLNSPAFTFSSDTDTGLYRYTDSVNVGAALAVSGIITVAGIASSGVGGVIANIPVTSSSSGFKFVLQSVFGTLHAYGSSEKLKENIIDIEGSGSVIDSLRPVQFNAVAKEGVPETPEEKSFRELDKQHGFIAEEVAGVGNGYLATYDNEFNPSGWKWPDMIALCVAEIQDLRSRVAQLEGL